MTVLPLRRPAESARPPAPSRRRRHVLLIVENVALDRDHRLQKQAAALLSAGYRVSVICRSDPGNRDHTGVGIDQYRAPAEAASKLGFVREYGYSWIMAAFLALKLLATGRVDAVQVSGTPDIYFAIAAPFKMLGKPLILDQRDSSPELYEVRYGRCSGLTYRALCLLERASFRAADHVITVNRSLERIACERAASRRPRSLSSATALSSRGP